MFRRCFLVTAFVRGTPAAAFVQQNKVFIGIQSNHFEHSFALGLGYNEATEQSSARRKMLFGALKASGLAAVLIPQPAFAGEVGARITKAVTQSDLGVSVRRSVVKGAQVIDSLDGKWEQFSGGFRISEMKISG